MRTVELDEQQEARLAEAAEVSGIPEAELIRRAIEEHCDRLLGPSIAERWADVIGSVAGDGSGYSRDTGKEFAEILERKYARKRDSSPSPD
ncbi:MAG: ribbon-helix-helix protein, CopG family [Armatimonadota bacterium]